MRKRKVYIDTDIGLGTPFAEIDDGVALMLLISCEEIDIVGIGSIFGNVPITDAYANLSRLLSLMHKHDVRLGFGAECPLAGDLKWFDDWKNGYGKTRPWEYQNPELSSDDLLIDIIKNSHEKITILSLGPMTNIALALQKEPGIITGIDELVTMGGMFSEESSLPEFNIHCDPVAANFVIGSGLKITMVGLDVSKQVVFSRDDFNSLNVSNQLLKLLKGQSIGWIDRVVEMGWAENGCGLHDAIAALFIIEPQLFQTTDVKIEIPLSAEKWGLTEIRKTQISGNHKIVSELDIEECHDAIWAFIVKIGEPNDG